MARGCVVVGGVVVVVATVTATMVYLGHAIDFHVSHHLPHSLLPAKSETKYRQNRVEKFFRNPAYIRYRIWCVRMMALTCSIGTWRFSLVRGKGPIEQDPSVLTSPPSDILISDKKQTFTRCRWFTPILSLAPARGSFYYQRATVFDYPFTSQKLSERQSRILRRVPLAFSARRLSLTIKVRPPWFHVDRKRRAGVGELRRRERYKRERRETMGVTET